MARPRLSSDPALRRVSSGTVSHPTKPPKWRPNGRRAVDSTPRIVKARGTSANG